MILTKKVGLSGFFFFDPLGCGFKEQQYLHFAWLMWYYIAEPVTLGICLVEQKKDSEEKPP
jgi:hypothetical protein